MEAHVYMFNWMLKQKESTLPRTAYPSLIDAGKGGKGSAAKTSSAKILWSPSAKQKSMNTNDNNKNTINTGSSTLTN